MSASVNMNKLRNSMVWFSRPRNQVMSTSNFPFTISASVNIQCIFSGFCMSKIVSVTNFLKGTVKQDVTGVEKTRLNYLDLSTK
jgi:hypothetical protein